jgi:hypothetical protein
VGDKGLETVAFSTENSHILDPDNAQNNVIDALDTPATPAPAFSLLAHAWPSLSLSAQKAILDIVRRAAKGVR